ncbi:MAG: EAL domain-containing protein [Campylobacterota bacterium]|nr:EAL domain-containing protein [Campylobacterota bacterium]
MKSLSLNLKILLIFFIPAIALVYFSFSFVQAKYKTLNESAMYKLSANITDSLSKLVHNLQIERGLSAGYIATSNHSKYKEKLQEQYISTDKAYTEFLKFVDIQSKEKNSIIQSIGHINQPLIKNIIKEMSHIEDIRTSVLKSNINFKDEIQYYSYINYNLIKAIKSFITILKKQSNDNSALSKLQDLKENAGLERAYIYNQLLSSNLQDNRLENIKTFQSLQDSAQEQFFIDASIKSTLIYTNIMKKAQEDNVIRLREKFFKNLLSNEDATKWFQVSTDRIEMLEKISSSILNRYIKISNDVYSNALNSLYFTALLWILSLVSLSILTYILRNLIKTEEHLMDELRISAYTFDSHEAMTITDVNGTILKVNDAFTKITGYSRSEVIGKNPRVLKSMKHGDDFYREMWRQINTAGKWSDEIYNKRKNDEIYMERLSITAIKNDKDITTHYIAQFLDISDVIKAQEEAQHQADHDFLTGLLNRKSLMQRLNEEFIKAKRHNFLHAFLFIDLDEFKAINDNYGHEVGDKLLIEFSLKLQQLVREEDIVARISGDEFAIIVLNINKIESEAIKGVKNLCNQIINTLKDPFILNENNLSISASIGIKLFPQKEKNIHDVMIHADTAMYQAKHQGKRQCVFFDKAIELKLKHYQLLEEEVKQAYKNNEFKIFFQPKIDTKSGKIVGAEALIRWQHPQKGLLYPDLFLETALDIGMTHNITLLALHNTCKFLESTQGMLSGTISINITSDELVNPLFQSELILIIKKYNIEASKIELEITENELIKDFDATIEIIKKLKEFGIKFAIDDFGTGYSSITYLQKLPVNSLKIDRSFLDNISQTADQELVSMIVNIAKTFNMCSIIEGVESKRQLEFIQKIDADQYQGFYFSKAVNEKGFKELLSRQAHLD